LSLRFLGIETIIEIHDRQLSVFGGLRGIRDAGLLDSALAQPKATFGGQFLHEDLFAMAAAYLFHIVSDHPFVDGNKRTGLASALTFLELNGYVLKTSLETLYGFVMDVAEGRLSKAQIADVFRACTRKQAD
jgi:death-on-curing protein